MKKTISALLAILLLFSCTTLTFTVSAKVPVVHAPGYIRIGVNRNAAKQLTLDWSNDYYYDDYNEVMPDGYQIFRSDSGKSGTYQKIATIKDRTFTDNDLKNGTVYYYKVRGYLKEGNQTYYSKSVKGCCSTKLTNRQATKLLQKAYRVAGMWMDLAQPNCNETKYITRPRTVTYDDGETLTFQGEYYLVTDKTITTKKELKKYLGRVFDQEQVNTFVDDLYVEKNGKLWMYHFDWGDGAGPFAQRDKVIYVSQTGDTMKFVNICNWGNDYDLFCDPIIHDLEFRNGSWIFTDEYWFRYYHFIDLSLS